MKKKDRERETEKERQRKRDRERETENKKDKDREIGKDQEKRMSKRREKGLKREIRNSGRDRWQKRDGERERERESSSSKTPFLAFPHFKAFFYEKVLKPRKMLKMSKFDCLADKTSPQKQRNVKTVEGSEGLRVKLDSKHTKLLTF